MIFAKGIFITLQESWSNFKFDVLKSIETEKLYNEHKSVLENFKKEGQINVIKDVSVHSASILNFERTSKKEFLDVMINSSMFEYILDEEKQKVIKGDKDFKINVTYQMRFERNKGVKTKKDSQKRKQNIKLENKVCPNCGAPLKPELYGWCEYCMGVSKEEETWLLNSIEIFENN